MDRVKRQARRTAIATVGGIVLVIGIIMIPYPGPGWLVVFAALAILSKEFDWAKRLLDYGRGKYDAWQAWMLKQNPGVQLLFGFGTLIVVVLTLWLLNGYGVINDFFHLGLDWTHSPFTR